MWIRRRSSSRTLLRGALLASAVAVLATVPAPVVAAAASPSPAPQPAPAGTGSARQATDTFGIGPGTATGLDTRRDHLNFIVDPGAHAADHVVLVNLAATPVNLAVYTADASTTSDGTISYAPKAQPGEDARTWISIDGHGASTQVTLPGRSTKVLPVAIAVPAKATPGDHVVGILASVTSKVTTSNGADPNLEQRIALRAFFRVSGTLTPKLEVTQLTADYSGTANPFGTGTATVSWVVRNAGNVNLGGTQKLDVSGLFGSTGSVPKLATIPLLLPGTSYPVRVTVPGVFPSIHLSATVTVTPLGAVGSANPALPTAKAEIGFWAVPWTLLALVVVVIALGVGYWRWRKAHPPTARHRPPASGNREPVGAGRS